MSLLRWLTRPLIAFWWRLRGRVRPPDETPAAELAFADPPTRRRPDDPALIVRVRAEAFAHVRSGMYDAWSFDTGTLPPYLAELRAERERTIMQLRNESAEHLRASRARVETVDAQADNAGQAMELEERRHSAAARQEEVVRAKLNWLATAEVRRRPALPGASPPVNGTAESDLDSAGTGPREVSCVHDQLPHECWEGLHTGHPLRARWKLMIMFALVGVDVPIQYEIFRYFHGDSVLEQVKTWIFALPVAAVVVLLPHLVGYLYRGRHVTGSERLMHSLPLALLLPWCYLAWRLGDLRAKVLLAPPVGPDGLPAVDPLTGKPLATVAGQLNVSTLSVSVMYVALLLITGGIAFLLGIAREHPMQVAYRGAYADLREAEAQVARAAPVARNTVSQRVQTHVEYEALDSSYEMRRAEGIEAIHALYDQAELAYMEALGEAVGTPAFTEAVARTSQAILQPRERREPEHPALPAAPWA